MYSSVYSMFKKSCLYCKTVRLHYRTYSWLALSVCLSLINNINTEKQSNESVYSSVYSMFKKSCLYCTTVRLQYRTYSILALSVCLSMINNINTDKTKQWVYNSVYSMFKKSCLVLYFRLHLKCDIFSLSTVNLSVYDILIIQAKAIS